MQVWEIGIIAPFYWLQKIAIQTIPSQTALHLVLKRRNSYGVYVYQIAHDKQKIFDAYRGKPALYKGKDIGAYVAGYVGEKYIILGFHDYTGCILRFTARVNKTLDGVYTSYRFAKLKYVEVVS